MTYSWVWASTPGGDAAAARVGASRASATRASRRSSSSKESTTMRPTPDREGPAQLVDRLVVAVQHEPIGRHARPRSATCELAAGRRRRGACPPRGPAGPWRGTGTPWSRRRRRRRRRRPPRGSGRAGGPRRRRTAACRTRRPAPAGRTPPMRQLRRRRRPRRCRAAAAAGPARRAHIDSGALTPSRSSPTASPMRAASASHKRAWVSSGVTRHR